MGKPDIIVPETLPEDKLKWKTTQDEVDYWNAHPKTQMPIKMWAEYYCSSTQHRGFHCSSCQSDKEYGIPYDDERCCCLAPIAPKAKGKVE